MAAVSSKQTGDWGERVVAQALERQGAVVLARQWRCEHGELDLIAREGNTLVIVEVKTRRTRALGWPEDAVGAAKQQRLRAAGEAYITATGWAGPWRIDVAAVERQPAGGWQVRWLRDAVQGG